MIEPYQYSLNEDLARCPDEVEIEPKDLESPWGLSVRDIIRKKSADLGLKDLANKSYDIGSEFFMFKIINDMGEEVDSTSLNFKSGILLDRVIMCKKKIAYEDSDIEKIVKNNMLVAIDNNYGRHSDLNISRINEIADLFNSNETKKQRSARKKMRELKNHLANLVQNKKLDIRDVGLAERFGKWVVFYIKDGNLAALNNITRLKIMTHQNKPIYSMEERGIQ
jgi:tellurite resistance protein